MYFSASNENDIPLFVLQYPDGSTLSGDNNLNKTNDTNPISIEFKTTVKGKKRDGVEVVEISELQKKCLTIVNRQVCFFYMFLHDFFMFF